MAKSIEWVTYSQVFAFLGNSLLSPMKQRAMLAWTLHSGRHFLILAMMLSRRRANGAEGLQVELSRAA